MFFSRIYLYTVFLLYFENDISQIAAATTLEPHDNLTIIINPIAPIRFNYNSQRLSRFLPNITYSIKKNLHTILDEEYLFSDWISDSKPSVIYIPFNGVKQLDNRGYFLLKFRNYTFFDKSGNRLNVSQMIIESFQRWLVQESGCAMDYIWSELNENYWPRWIKKGLCVSTTSCSWPPGMNCKPRLEKKLTLLYWNCEDDVNHTKYDADQRALENEQKKYRRKRQNDPIIRHKTVNRRFRSRRIVRSRKHKEIKTRKLIMKLSKHDDGIYCRWQKKSYFVVDSCSCYC